MLSAADVYVFPSRHEGLPVAPLEAMACGLPVVAADATGVEDVVGDTGLVVPRGDVDALAVALDDLLADVERARSSACARDDASRSSSLSSPSAQRLRDFLLGRRRAVTRIAYVVSAYKLPGAARPARAAAAAPGVTFVVHVDRKTRLPVCDEMVRGARGLDVDLAAAPRSQWGGFGHVRATLKGLDHVVANGVSFDYAMLLTGQDYPLRSPAEIARRLGAADGRSFMRHSSFRTRRGASEAASSGSRTGTWSRTGGCTSRCRSADACPAGSRPSAAAPTGASRSRS